jgi:hypothetical protein
MKVAQLVVDDVVDTIAMKNAIKTILYLNE